MTDTSQRLRVSITPRIKSTAIFEGDTQLSNVVAVRAQRRGAEWDVYVVRRYRTGDPIDNLDPVDLELDEQLLEGDLEDDIEGYHQELRVLTHAVRQVGGFAAGIDRVMVYTPDDGES